LEAKRTKFMSIQGAKLYEKLSRRTSVEDANPHEVISILFGTALDRLNQALGCIERNDYEMRGKCLGQVIDIISGLQNFLNHEKGAEIAKNLDSLYEYMLLRLSDATINNEKEPVDEVIVLLTEIYDGWKGIAGQAKQILSGGRSGEPVA